MATKMNFDAIEIEASYQIWARIEVIKQPSDCCDTSRERYACIVRKMCKLHHKSDNRSNYQVAR